MIDLELCNTIRMKLIIDRAIDGLNLMIADKIKRYWWYRNENNDARRKDKIWENKE